MRRGELPRNAVPQEIIGALESLVRRSRAVLLARGVAAVVVAAIASLLVAMAVHRWAVFFSAWPRWCLSMSAVALTVLVAVVFLIRPLAKTFTLVWAARMIELRHPELHERISSAIELLTSREADSIRGSGALIAALAGEAALDARGVRPWQEVSLRPARPFLIAAIVTVALLAGVFAVWPHATGQLLRRALSPHRDLGTFASARLLVRPDSDQVVLEGRAFDVTVIVSDKRTTSAEFRTRNGDGRETVEEMASVGRTDEGLPKFVTTCVPNGKDFRYRIHAGGALTRHYRVTVVPRPAVDRFQVTYHYPDYAGGGTSEATDEPDIQALAGTRVRLRAYANKPVIKATLLVNNEEAGTAGVSASVCTFEVELTPGLKGTYRVALLDEHDFQGATDEHTIAAISDAKPFVRIVKPTETHLRLPPKDRLPIDYTLGDDIGLASAHVEISIDAQPPRPVRLPLPDKDGKAPAAVIGKTAIDLGEPAYLGARRITFRIHAADTLPGELEGPQTAKSRQYTIRLDDDTAAYAKRVQLAEEIHISEALREVSKSLEAARNESSKLAAELQPEAGRENAGAELTADQAQRVKAIRENLAGAYEKIQEVMPVVNQGTYTPMAAKLTDLAEGQIAKAEHTAAGIQLAEQALERSERAKDTDFAVRQAQEEVAEMLGEYGQMRRAMHEAQQLKEIAEQQARLAEQARAAEQLLPSAPSQEQVQKQQDQIARQLGQMVRQSPQAMADQAKRNTEQAANLAQQAGQLAVRQQSLTATTEQLGQLPRQGQAAQALQQAQQKQLQREQAQLAREAAQLAQQLQKVAPQNDQLDSRAARQAQEAADQLAGAQPPQAAQAAAKAAEKLAQLAERLGAQPQAAQQQSAGNTPSQGAPGSEPGQGQPGQPSQVIAQGAMQQEPGRAGSLGQTDAQAQQAQLARAAASLAGRQQQLAGQTQDLAAGRSRSVEAARQAGITQATSQTARGTEMVRDLVEDTFPEAGIQAAANQALERLGQARQAQAQAGAAITDPSQTPAAPARQQQAAVSLQQAAAALTRMGQLIEHKAAEDQPEPPETDQSRLDEALAAARAAAQEAKRQDIDEAAQLLAQLAQHASRQAEQMGLEMSGQAPGDQSSQASTPGGGGQGSSKTDQAVQVTLARLKELGLTQSDWEKLHGKLSGDVLEAGQKQGPAEYRRLIKEYFQSIVEAESGAGGERK